MARSDIHALTTWACPRSAPSAPKTLVPGDLREMGVRVCHDMAEGIRDADVIIMLRLQNERMSGAMLPSRRVLQELRPDAREAGARQTRRHRDAPGPDQPRRRDRLQRG